MLPGMMSPIAGRRTGRMIDVLGKLGLTTNLKLCLDAGDIASVASAAPDKWLDVSGNGTDFFLGSGTGADSADPTFNGTPGGQSVQYWSFGGGDYFKYDTTSETWMDAFHKDSATFTFAAWVLVPVGAAQFAFFGNSGGDDSPGVTLTYRGATNAYSFAVYNGSAQAFSRSTTSFTVDDDAWHFVSLAIDEAADALLFKVDGSTLSSSATYSSPSSSAATDTMFIGSDAGVTGTAPIGVRMASAMMWSSALSAGQLETIRGATRGKFGV